MSTPVASYNPIPSTHDVSIQRTQFIENLAGFTMPGGKVFIAGRGDYTIAECDSRGITHYSKYDLTSLPGGDITALVNAGRTYDAVPRIENFMNLTFMGGPENWLFAPDGTTYNTQWWPTGPLDNAAATAKGNSVDISHLIWIGETQEGSSWIRPGHPMWKAFFSKMRERAEAKWAGSGKQPLIAANYFHFDFLPFAKLDTNAHTKSYFKTEYAKPVGTWPSSDYSPGGSLSDTNMICNAVYYNAPDETRKAVRENIFRALCNTKMGYYTCTFAVGRYEWRPNNMQSRWFPEAIYGATDDGTFFRSDKILMNPNVLMAQAFWGWEYGKMVHEWYSIGKSSHTKMAYPYAVHDLWYPHDGPTNTGTTVTTNIYGQRIEYANSFPHYTSDQNLWFDPALPGSNWIPYAEAMYAATLGQCTGSGDSEGYCEFRIDGGSWIVPDLSSDASEIIESYFEDRGYMRWRRKSGKFAWAWQDETGPNTKRLIEFKHPTNGITYSTYVCGSSVYAGLITE